MEAHMDAKTVQSVTPEHIMQVGLGFWASKTLLSAIELELFTLLAKQPAGLGEVKSRLGLHQRSARDFLDALVALGFLDRRDGIYRNTAATDMFLDKAKPSYIGGMLEMVNARLFGFWNRFTEAVRSGEPQNETKGGSKSFFEAVYAEPARLREFLKAMTGMSHATNLAIARQFPWTDYKGFVDLGAAQGDLVVQVARAHPHLAGLGFDLPEVGPIVRDYVAHNGLNDRVQFAPADFFRAPIPQADVAIMSRVLHDLDLAQRKGLIHKAYGALPVGGALIVVDTVIDDDRRYNAFGLLMSLNMLIETPGGFDYTGADCIGWMKECGFRKPQVEPLVGPDSMVIGIK
jgi:hypothetical protein